MTDPTDLGLADIAPVTLEDDVFEGMLDYAVSEDAHDVDDSLVPADEAPDDAGDVDDIDDVDDFDGDAAGFGVDGFDDVPVDDGVLDASPDEDPGLGVDMDW